MSSSSFMARFLNGRKPPGKRVRNDDDDRTDRPIKRLQNSSDSEESVESPENHLIGGGSSSTSEIKEEEVDSPQVKTEECSFPQLKQEELKQEEAIPSVASAIQHAAAAATNQHPHAQATTVPEAEEPIRRCPFQCEDCSIFQDVDDFFGCTSTSPSEKVSMTACFKKYVKRESKYGNFSLSSSASREELRARMMNVPEGDWDSAPKAYEFDETVDPGLAAWAREWSEPGTTRKQKEGLVKKLFVLGLGVSEKYSHRDNHFSLCKGYKCWIQDGCTDHCQMCGMCRHWRAPHCEWTF